MKQACVCVRIRVEWDIAGKHVDACVKCIPKYITIKYLLIVISNNVE